SAERLLQAIGPEYASCRSPTQLCRQHNISPCPFLAAMANLTQSNDAISLRAKSTRASRDLKFDPCSGSCLRPRCLLWVKSRHRGTSNQCPLYPQKQTLELAREMSALCQKQTLHQI